MSFSGGTFSINTSGQPVVNGTSISATVFNAFTADIATGLSTCILKDGTQTATAGIPFYAGTVSLPGIYFGTDTATGFYRIGLNNTGFAINGTKLLDLSSTLVGITGSITASGTANSIPAPTATATNLQNSWADQSGETSQYYKDATGTVHLQGRIQGGTTTGGTLLFTLASGFRPAQNTVVTTSANNAICVLVIGTNGEVTIGNGASATWTALEGITFRVA